MSFEIFVAIVAKLIVAFVDYRIRVLLILPDDLAPLLRQAYVPIQALKRADRLKDAQPHSGEDRLIAATRIFEVSQDAESISVATLARKTQVEKESRQPSVNRDEAERRKGAG